MQGENTGDALRGQVRVISVSSTPRADSAASERSRKRSAPPKGV